MSVRRFRSVEGMERSAWYPPGDPRLWKAIASVWEFGERVTAPRFPPGVYKHRTIEDLNRQREAWDTENFRAFWERRKR